MDPVSLFVANVVHMALGTFEIFVQFIVSILNFITYLAQTVLQILHLV
jgi:hypothetical protein